jgi:hypothetical protein
LDRSLTEIVTKDASIHVARHIIENADQVPRPHFNATLGKRQYSFADRITKGQRLYRQMQMTIDQLTAGNGGTSLESILTSHLFYFLFFFLMRAGTRCMITPRRLNDAFAALGRVGPLDVIYYSSTEGGTF